VHGLQKSPPLFCGESLRRFDFRHSPNHLGQLQHPKLWRSTLCSPDNAHAPRGKSSQQSILYIFPILLNISAMDDGERRSAKRSRFDQTEPEPRKTSRFDRRSRSPPARKSDSGRDRSPISRGSRGRDSSTPDVKSPVDPAAAAGKKRHEPAPRRSKECKANRMPHISCRCCENQCTATSASRNSACRRSAGPVGLDG